MPTDLDLSIEIAGIRFKNPVLPAASELVFDQASALRLVRAGVGGLVTKTFTSAAASRIRPRPYHFPLAPFGDSFRESGSFCSLAAPHVQDMEVVLGKNLVEIAQTAHEHGLPLVASFYESPDDLTRWEEVARGMQNAGADMLELNFSSPTMRGALEKDLRIGFAILEAVGRKVDIPWGVKISPMLEPLIETVQGWKQRGAAFISAHNAPSGFFVDVDRETPYGAPMPAGYLIGRPFLPVSLARVVRILSQVDIEVLGIGGIFSAQDALQYLLCGCSACGLATAAYIKGIGVFQKVLDQLSEWMQKKNYRCILDFKGKVLRQMRPAPEVLAGETAPYAQPPHTPYLPRIDPEKCRFCLTCCQSCLYQALEADHEAKVIKVRADRCWSCGFCVGICPHGAIELVSRRSGETVWMGRGLASPFQ